LSKANGTKASNKKNTKIIADARLSRQLVSHCVASPAFEFLCLAINWFENDQLIGHPWSNGGVTIIMTC
jgi:hypothetical protein